jgi:hypothetical protein
MDLANLPETLRPIKIDRVIHFGPSIGYDLLSAVQNWTDESTRIMQLYR